MYDPDYANYKMKKTFEEIWGSGRRGFSDCGGSGGSGFPRRQEVRDNSRTQLEGGRDALNRSVRLVLLGARSAGGIASQNVEAVERRAGAI